MSEKRMDVAKKHSEGQGKNRSENRYVLLFERENMLEGSKMKSYCVRFLIGNVLEPTY